MKSLSIILSLFVLTIFVSASMASAFSWSSLFSTDFIKVREKWSYQEDTTGKLRGFNLIHTFFVPRDTVQQTYNDKPTNQNTQVVSGNGLAIGGGFGSSNGLVVGGGFGSGGVNSNSGYGGGSSFGSSNSLGLTNDYAISDAFGTFRENNGGYGGGSSNYGFGGGIRW